MPKFSLSVTNITAKITLKHSKSQQRY